MYASAEVNLAHFCLEDSSSFNILEKYRYLSLKGCYYV